MARCSVAILLLLASCGAPDKSGLIVTELSPVIWRPDAALETTSSQVLFQAQAGRVSDALSSYNKLSEKDKRSCLPLLCQTLIHSALDSSDPALCLAGIYGAYFSQDARFTSSLSACLDSWYAPQIQAACVHALGSFADDEASKILTDHLNTQSLGLRLEIISVLATNQPKIASSQLDTILHQLPLEILPYFCQILGQMQDPASLRTLKQWLSHSDGQTRLAALATATQFGLDELQPTIRTIATHSDRNEQQACALAFARFGDTSASDTLQSWASSNDSELAFVATLALAKLHSLPHRKALAQMAAQNPFATYQLGDFPEEASFLRALLSASDPDIALNAALALLKQRDVACASEIQEVLRHEPSQRTYQASTMAQILPAWRLDSKNPADSDEVSAEMQLRFQESLLQEVAFLSNNTFIRIAEAVLNSSNTALIPTCMRLLEEAESESSVALLRAFQKKSRMPLARHWANLTLWKLYREPETLRTLLGFVESHANTEVMQFRPLLGMKSLEAGTKERLSAAQSSELLMASFVALASAQDPQTNLALLACIEKTAPTNRPILAALLLQASQ